MMDGELEAVPRLVWDVGSLLAATGDALWARFGAVAVRGELSTITRAASGHLYFTLKDSAGATALLRCAMFRRAAVLLDYSPAEGTRVELRGRLAVFEPRGELQLIAESMRRVGEGALYEEFLRLKAKLEAQGLFDPARKRPPPRWPRALGVVTSLGAAALRDVVTTVERRSPQVRLVIYPCAVQGAEAPPSIVEALRVAASRAEVDALLLVRGGGSLEDLWAFNDERVVRAVAASALVVVCGVGHETDLTLADLAADLRAPTPTAAAELAAPQRSDALAELAKQRKALEAALRRALDRQAERLDRAQLRLARPAAALAAQRSRVGALEGRVARSLRHSADRRTQQLRELAARLGRAAATGYEVHGLRLDAQAQRLRALDPHQVLQRGFAWIESAAGTAVVSVRQVSAGDAVRAVWADGQALARVEAVEPRSQRG
jgi:exodeoxyribonuclease VII large subunit